ncbi:Glycerophosphoryl diester phosphodiesterase [compost metagenome]
MLLIFIGLLIAFLIYRHFTWRALVWPNGAGTPARYQAHRGYCKKGDRENTLASFRQAKLQKFEMIELDVHLSKDEVPVVFHDEDLQRLGERSDYVRALTALQLKEYVQAPTLEEVLMSPDVPEKVNIEVKSKSYFGNALEQRVCEVVTRCGAQNRVQFSSFNPLSLWRLKKQLPQVPRALLATKEPDPSNKIYLKHLWFAPYIGIHALHLDHRYVSFRELKAYVARGIPVALWTVNDEKKAQDLLASGALSIISDEILF